MTIADHLRLAGFDPGAQGAEIGVDLVTRTQLTQSEAKDKHKQKQMHSSEVVLSLYQMFEICDKSHGNTLQRCQRERIALVRKLQQHKYPLPLQQNSNWLGNCATALAHRSIIPRASALRPRALSAPSQADLPSLVCISEMEIA